MWKDKLRPFCPANYAWWNKMSRPAKLFAVAAVVIVLIELIR